MLKCKIQSLLWISCNLLTVTTYKITIKKAHYICPPYPGIEHRLLFQNVIGRKQWHKSRPNSIWAISKLCICMSDVQLLSVLMTPTNFFLFGWFYSLLGKYPTVLESRFCENLVWKWKTLGYPRQFQHYKFLFKCLESTQDLPGISKGLWPLLQFCSL